MKPPSLLFVVPSSSEGSWVTVVRIDELRDRARFSAWSKNGTHGAPLRANSKILCMFRSLCPMYMSKTPATDSVDKRRAKPTGDRANAKGLATVRRAVRQQAASKRAFTSVMPPNPQDGS
jgi:hypothetical protein